MAGSRLTVRRASAPAAFERIPGTAPVRQYDLRAKPLKPILKQPPSGTVRKFDLEVASLQQNGRKRRDEYVGEIGVKAERWAAAA
jgi:hypothetical protein